MGLLVKTVFAQPKCALYVYVSDDKRYACFSQVFGGEWGFDGVFFAGLFLRLVGFYCDFLIHAKNKCFCM